MKRPPGGGGAKAPPFPGAEGVSAFEPSGSICTLTAVISTSRIYASVSVSALINDHWRARLPSLPHFNNQCRVTLQPAVRPGVAARATTLFQPFESSTFGF
jgi:hypothetical protein